MIQQALGVLQINYLAPMFRALIIDDEISTIRVLEILMRKFVPDIAEVHTAVGAHAGIDQIKTLHPDLVFLDIDMPGMDGFDLLRQIPDPTFEVIFVTAYSQYAIQAIRFSAFDYIMKPVDVKELQQAVERFKFRKKSVPDTKMRHGHLLQNIHSKDVTQFTLSIHTVEGVHFLPISDIVYCEADGNYTHFYMANKKRIVASKPLLDFETLLDPNVFMRVHKSYLVNKKQVKLLIHQGSLLMADGTTVEVARRKRAEVKKWLKGE